MSGVRQCWTAPSCVHVSDSEFLVVIVQTFTGQLWLYNTTIVTPDILFSSQDTESLRRNLMWPLSLPPSAAHLAVWAVLAWRVRSPRCLSQCPVSCRPACESDNTRTCHHHWQSQLHYVDITPGYSTHSDNRWDKSVIK